MAENDKLLFIKILIITLLKQDDIRFSLVRYVCLNHQFMIDARPAVIGGFFNARDLRWL